MMEYRSANYTPEEISILRKRGQPVITINRLGRKIGSMMEFLFGVVVGAVLALFVMTAFAHTVGLPW